MTEPDVTLTDYLIAIEAAAFAALIWRIDRPASDAHTGFLVFFAATAVAAAAGGTVHGFFPGRRSPAGVALWRATLLSIGAAAWAAWAIGAGLFLPAGPAAAVRTAAVAVAVGYAAVVAAGSDRFSVAVAHYLPAALFLLIGFAVGAAREPSAPMLAGTAGMLLTCAAAAVQVKRIAIHRAYFNHNATYHVIQAAALVLIYTAGRDLA